LALAYMLEEMCCFVALEYEDATIVEVVSAPAPYLAGIFLMTATPALKDDYGKLKLLALLVLFTGISAYILSNRLRLY